MDSNPLATFVRRLPLFFTFIVFWLAPGLGTIAAFYPNALVSYDVTKLLIFAIALPAPLIVLNFAWCVALRPKAPNTRFRIIAPVTASGTLIYILIAIQMWRGDEHAAILGFYKTAVICCLALSASYFVGSSEARAILQKRTLNSETGKDTGKKGSNQPDDSPDK